MTRQSRVGPTHVVETTEQIGSFYLTVYADTAMAGDAIEYRVFEMPGFGLGLMGMRTAEPPWF